MEFSVRKVMSLMRFIKESSEFICVVCGENLLTGNLRILISY